MNEAGMLSPWAQMDRDTRGRRHAEQEHAYRSPYARDRDRVIHCRAFRRLEYKTQVFVNHEGDHYRTRLTHSIEVAQIARTAARALGLNGDLVESLALSHDLGHTPFGHLGEDILGPLMEGHGGFNHNRQTLRVVELLEKRYPAFPGLNLTWEVREGIVKHSGPSRALEHPEVAEYLPGVPPTLEAQMIDLVDEIAYNHHDLEDGFESRLLDLESLCDLVPLFADPFAEARAAWPDQGRWMWIKIALRRVIDHLVTDLIEVTRTRIEETGVRSVEDVRAHEEWMVGMSPPRAEANRRLKEHLHEALYKHPAIQKAKEHFAQVLRDLFAAYVSAPASLPPRYRERVDLEGAQRSACDYIAGMTDRFALDEHHRLCGGPGPHELPSATR
jgi:dGTPase